MPCKFSFSLGSIQELFQQDYSLMLANNVNWVLHLQNIQIVKLEKRKKTHTFGSFEKKVEKIGEFRACIQIFFPFNLLNFMESNILELLCYKCHFTLCCHLSSSVFQCSFKCLMTRIQNNEFILLKIKGKKEGEKKRKRQREKN